MREVAELENPLPMTETVWTVVTSADIAIGAIDEIIGVAANGDPESAVTENIELNVLRCEPSFTSHTKFDFMLTVTGIDIVGLFPNNGAVTGTIILPERSGLGMTRYIGRYRYLGNPR